MNLSASAARRLRIAGYAAGGLLVLVLLALLLLSFGWGLLRPLAERRASAALKRPVTIERIRRVGGGLFHPVLAIEGVRIAQPAWAGPGDMVRLQAAEVRIAALPLLAGRLRPKITRLDGLQAALVRRADNVANWQGEKRRGEGDMPDLGSMLVHDARITLDDRRNRYRFALRLEIDAKGFHLDGPGTVGETAATLHVEGPPVGGQAPWPFDGEVRSAAVTLRARGRMQRPLDLAHLDAQVASRGRNLIDLDHLIQAGLFETQPYALRAAVHRDGSSWRLRGLAGTLGRSALRADLEIGREADDRHLVKGSVIATALDFDDLASDETNARARALAHRLGPRLVPPTKIDLSKLRRTDGELHFDIRRILAKQPTVFRSVTGTATLDHGVLTMPARARLVAGTLAGTAVVRHQTGTPLLLLDLRLQGGRLEKLVQANGIVTGPLEGRVTLRGRGETVRAAVGESSGRIGLVSRGGSITRRVALLVGADVGRGLFAGNSDRTGLRCLVADMAVGGGVARPSPLVIDTDVARADGTGTIRLADERVDIDLHGRPKRDSILRLNGPIHAGGTLEQPTFNPPPQTKTVGGLLKMVGKAIGGHQDPLAADADCARLSAKALR